MIKRFKALRIVTYSLLGIILMLFFVFLITYDFDKESSYLTYATYDESMDEFDRILSDSRNESTGINIAHIDLDSSYFNTLFISLIRDGDNESEYIYENDDWKLKGINIEFDDEIIMNFYLKYTGNFNYSIRLSAYFDFNETSEYYSLVLKRLTVGTVIIPRSIVRNVLSKKNDNSIGGIVSDLLSIVPFGTYNSEDISYDIYKDEISSAVEMGYMGSRILDDDGFLMTTSASYLSILFPNDCVDISVSSALNITLDYSKLINSETSVKGDTYSGEITTSNDNNLLMNHYDCFYKLLSSDETFSLTSEEIKNLYLYNIKTCGNNLESEYVKMYSSKTSVYGNELHIVENMMLFDLYSKIDYVYVYKDDGYYLDKIEIGRDESEKENEYLTISDKDSINQFLRSLQENGINTNYITYKLDMDSLTGLNTDGSFYKKGMETLDFTISEDSVIHEIYNGIMSDEFKNTVRESFSSFDNSSSESLNSFYETLSLNDKEKFFYIVKDFFKSETIVYNYIIDILN